MWRCDNRCCNTKLSPATDCSLFKGILHWLLFQTQMHLGKNPILVLYMIFLFVYQISYKTGKVITGSSSLSDSTISRYFKEFCDIVAEHMRGKLFHITVTAYILLETHMYSYKTSCQHQLALNQTNIPSSCAQRRSHSEYVRIIEFGW